MSVPFVIANCNYPQPYWYTLCHRKINFNIQKTAILQWSGFYFDASLSLWQCHNNYGSGRHRQKVKINAIYSKHNYTFDYDDHYHNIYLC